MDRPRLIRGLRIAVSVMCGILCVLLIVLWVRSGTRCEIASLGTSAGPGYVLESANGSVSAFYLPLSTGYVSRGFETISQAVDERVASRWGLGDVGGFGFKSLFSFVYIAVAPHWFLVLCASILAVAPWIGSLKRFSLRTLLIATTLIAVLLATAAYLRSW